MSEKMWCRIGFINDRLLVGYTPNQEKVVITRTYKGGDLDRAEPGDIISFIPEASALLDHGAKYYARYPKLIAKRFDSGRPLVGSDWKARKESETDGYMQRSTRRGDSPNTRRVDADVVA